MNRQTSINRGLPWAAVLISVVALGAIVPFLASRGGAQAPGNDQLDAEIAAAGRDVAGAVDPSQRALAQEKLKILLDERATVEAAAKQPPASRAGEEAKARALADEISRNQADHAPIYVVVRDTDRGEIRRTGSPASATEFVSGGTVWVSDASPAGLRTYIYGGVGPNGHSALRIHEGRDGDLPRFVKAVSPVSDVGKLVVVDEQMGVLQIDSDAGRLTFDIVTATFG